MSLMSYRFACALLASFLFGFAAVHLQPESPSRERAVDAAHRLPPGGMHSKVAAAAKPAYPLSRLEEETRHSAAFNDLYLWVRRTSLSAYEPRQRLGLDAVDDGAAPLTDSETAAAPVDAQGNGNADGNDPQTQLKSANNADTRIYILYGQYGFHTS